MFRLSTTYDFKGRAAFAAFAPRNWSETLSFTIPFSYLHFMTLSWCHSWCICFRLMIGGGQCLHRNNILQR